MGQQRVASGEEAPHGVALVAVGGEGRGESREGEVGAVVVGHDDGVEEPVYHQGVCIDTIHKYSDTLLIFLLKGHAPAKYRENHRVEHTGDGGGPLVVMPVAVDYRVAIAALAPPDEE